MTPAEKTGDLDHRILEQLRQTAPLFALVDERLREFEIPNDTERRVLLAAVLVSEDGVALSRDIRQHALLETTSQTTYHRALQRLVDRGLLAPTAAWSGSYRVTVTSN